MTINWYGEGCFKIQTEGLAILTDPFESKTGLPAPRFKPDVVLKTIAAAGDLLEAENDPETFLIKGPGEYEIKNVYIRGILLADESDKDFIKTVYWLEAEKIKLCFLGHLSDLPESQVLEELSGSDIVFAPAGGPPFISPAAAAGLIRQIEPKLVIPAFYAVPGLKRKAAPVGDFVKEMKESEEAGEKLVVKKKDLTNDKTRVVILKP